MRLYRNIAEAIVKGLVEIHGKQNLATYVVPKLLKSNKKWGARDRNAIASTIYDMTRNWRYLTFIANIEQFDEANIWKVLGVNQLLEGQELPPWDEFAKLTIDQSKVEEAKQQFAIKESIPDWLNELGKEQLGQELWEAEIAALNQPASVVLRVNPIAIPKSQRQNSREFVQKELLKQNISTELLEKQPFGLKMQERKSILHTKAYQKGWVEIQDANSQLVAPFCNPKIDNLIIDACAGAGGKSLHFASLVNNEADIFSIDVEPNKIRELQRRANRAHAHCIESGVVTDFPLDDFTNKADIVLLDAPCSGTGTIKRDPDKKWKLSPTFFKEISSVQAHIMQDYAPLTKVGGQLVYATCSIFPSENQEQVQAFLATEIGTDFELQEEQTLYAHKTGFDGFYMAKMIRKA